MDNRLKSRSVFGMAFGFLLLSFCVIGFSTASADQGVNTEETPMAVADGSEVSIEYTLKVEGRVMDTSVGAEPLTYVHGRGELIPGLERELLGMQEGESKQVQVSPDEGYGQVDPGAFLEIQKDQLEPGLEAEVGMLLSGQDDSGRPFHAQIAEISDEALKLDLNHPLAGKTLEFEVKVLSVTPGE